MKTLYFDLGMGAAGDMLTAALLELLPEPDAFLKKLNSLQIHGVIFEKVSSEKCGIRGTHMTVKVNGQEEERIDHHHHEHEHDHKHHYDYSHSHSHRSLHDIEHIVCDHMKLPEKVKADVMAVYKLIAEAESAVHGVPVTENHFHEVGTMDAIADITAVCMLMNELSPDVVIASPIHVGSGHVHCSHGILPVPAPATAYILKDVPIYGGSISGELCTPTGAAILKHFVTKFGDMPVMTVSAVGYGMGKKDFETVNCVRAMLGETQDSGDEIIELSCNMDDMTGEKTGFAMERLFEAGALDVYTLPIGMKKNRPGILLRVMCRESDKEAMIRAIFKHTTTIGIREQKMQRYILQREIEAIETPLGTIRKKSSYGYGVEHSKWEYEDLRKIAFETGLSIDEVEKEIENGN